MIMDRRGQISLEFVLILALMAVIVGAIGWYAGNANEQNVITSAVRSAADNATTTLAMLNRTMKPVTVEDITTTTTGNNIVLQVDISGSLSSNQNQVIKSSILSSIASQGYNVTSNTIVTNKHVYTIQVV
ncbi:TadE/TadG family type IV pilus assembly protein [Methanobacterium sp. MBAC-LM]|uniref:TadE/TadG family type IV pilus assembly protein n=1 Tax=Methanobacterium sp. MBAC-LM TaxID=3412034 RepID=UPI003C781B47